MIEGERPAFKGVLHELRNLQHIAKLGIPAAATGGCVRAYLPCWTFVCIYDRPTDRRIHLHPSFSSHPPQNQHPNHTRLYTLATSVVDFLGARVVAQSIIPGILSGDQQSRLVYGAVESGVKIKVRVCRSGVGDW